MTSPTVEANVTAATNGGLTLGETVAEAVRLGVDFELGEAVALGVPDVVVEPTVQLEDDHAKTAPLGLAAVWQGAGALTLPVPVPELAKQRASRAHQPQDNDSASSVQARQEL